MEYNIKAIETKFKGFKFRSRLEAKWAAMFELLGWNWDYEPVDFNGWIPDFVIYGKSPVYVEVKPVIEFPEDVAAELEASGCKDEMLIVGQNCLIDNDICFGWLCDIGYDSDQEDHEFWWAEAAFGRWLNCNGKIGFCHTTASFTDRIGGGYDGGCFGEITLETQEIKNLWAQAHNLTRWNKYK